MGAPVRWAFSQLLDASGRSSGWSAFFQFHQLLKGFSGEVAKALVAVIEAKSRDRSPHNLRNCFGQRPKTDFTLAGNRFLPRGRKAANETKHPVDGKQQQGDRDYKQEMRDSRKQVRVRRVDLPCIFDARETHMPAVKSAEVKIGRDGVFLIRKI